MKKLLFVTLFVFASIFSTHATVYNINVSTSGFQPANVTLKLGDTLHYVWSGGVHELVSDDGIWTSFPVNASNQQADLVIDTIGIFTWHCFQHPGETGTYTVTAPVVGFEITSMTVNEGDGVINFNVTIDNPNAFTQVTVSGTGGTAVLNSDYTLSGGTTGLGSATKTLALSITDDNIPEPAETIVLEFSNVINANVGNNDQLTITVNDNDPSGIREADNRDITLYPNTVSAGLGVWIKGAEKLQHIKLYNLKGELLNRLETTHSTSMHRFDTEGLTPGLYLLELVSEKGSTVKKLMVQGR